MSSRECFRLLGVRLVPETAFGLRGEQKRLDTYTFYHIVCHKEYVFHLWCLMIEETEEGGCQIQYGFSVYAHGKPIDPSVDERFVASYTVYFGHTKKNWTDCHFPTLRTMITFIEGCLLP